MVRKRPFRNILLGAAAFAGLWAVWVGISILRLPSVAPLANPKTSLVLTVKDWNGKDHPYVLGPRNRDWTPLSAVPASMRKAVIASEDANFYVHEGVDYEAIREAIKADIRKGRFVRGGSTITQQVAKNVFLSREKTVSRKIKEIVLARRIDDVLSKSRILEIYLNAVEFGPMVYGIGHASRYYFGKSPSGLTVRESAFLAAMLPGPKVYNPYRRMDRVMRRSERILRRMAGSRMIGEAEYRLALAEVPNLAGLARKVEKTLSSPPPEEPPSLRVPERGLEVLESPGEGTAEPPGTAHSGSDEGTPDEVPQEEVLPGVREISDRENSENSDR
jgi:monofunctional biosynthetic peptidoglycan transglycosylase